MKVEIIDTLAEVEPLRDPWNALAADNILLSWDWLISWWEAYGTARRLAVITVSEDAGNVLGIAPWYVEHSMFGPSIHCLGSGKACTDYMSVLVQPEFRDEVVDQLVAFLVSAIAGTTEFRLAGAHFLEFDSLEPDADWLARLAEGLEQAEFSIDRKPNESSWRVTLPADWDTLLDRMSRNARRKARKAMRRLEAGTVSFQTTDVDNFWPHFETFVELHQKRRTMLGQDGCFADSRFLSFLKSASARLLERRAVRIQSCQLQSQPIAAQFQLVGNDTIFMYQSGMDPAHGELEPGHTMLAGALADAMSSGHRVFDFLRGDEPYKAAWLAQRVPLQRLRFIAPSFGARFRDGWTAAARRVRDAARSMFDRDGS